MSQRTVIIGDVHGCIEELDRLLKKLSLGPKDRLIFARDLVNKGPATIAVLKRARELKAECVLGNHEIRLLRYRQGENFKTQRLKDIKTALKLTEADWAYLEAMPLHIELPEHNAIVVHGGFLPGIPWRKQGEEIITRIQTIDENNEACKRTKAPDVRYWAESWEGPEFVIYGHTPRREIYKMRDSIGLDTGCVYGGHLSALTLPERSITQVKAGQAYEASAKF